MKRKISKIWGVGLTIVIAASLILWTAPVSAGTLSWSSEDLPDEFVDTLGDNVLDVAVSADGGVIYAVAGSGVGVEFETWGEGIGEWSTTAPPGYAGDYCVTLDGPMIVKVPYGETLQTFADVNTTEVEGHTVWDIVWTIHDTTTAGSKLHAKVYLDTTLDGEVDVVLTGGFGATVPARQNGMWLDAYMKEGTAWQIDTYVDGDFTGGATIDGVVYSSYPPGYTLSTLLADETAGDDWAAATVVYLAYGYGPGTDAPGYVDDITVGDVIYEMEPGLVGPGEVYRSTNGGESWSTLAQPNGSSPELVAVTPDDENYIAVVADGIEVYVSDDAGATWDTLTADVSGLGLNFINDLAISAAKGGYHYVAVAGEKGTEGQIWYYKVGGVGSEWEDATDAEEGFGNATFAGAVAFSPNFASDEVMVAVTAFDGTADNVLFQIFSFDQGNWNEAAGFDGYPVDLTQETLSDPFTLDSASIALSPDYLGSDDSMRLAFVGLALGGTEAEVEDTTGIQRIEDDDNDVLKDGVNIHSIAYDGTDLVAGKFDGATVYRCADPLASSPSAKGSAGLKSPGGDDRVVVAFAGNKVVAGTSGDESAFAVSGDEGKTFNDISLIDTTLVTLSDVAVSPDGSNVYLVTDDGNDLSLWRYASAWERVLAVDDKTDFIVRLAPDDADVVFVADASGDSRTIYYSAKGGDVKWFTRISTYNIDDLAVEGSGSVVYVAEAGSGYVSKSTNGGFTWGSKKSSKLDDISMIVSLGEDLLLAGSTNGKAAYSTDGNSSWSKLSGGMTSGVVSVIADGLDEGDLICAGVDDDDGGDHLYRWDWDDEEWDDIVGVADDYVTTGIALQDGVLYAVADNGTDSKLYRSLNPTSDDPSFNTVDSEGSFDVTPSALRVSVSDTTIKLWSIDSVDPALFSYKDTLAAVAPTLLGPADGFLNKMNPISGKAFDITFSWERPSKNVDAYDFVIALDSDFNEVVLDQVRVKDSSKVGVVAGPTGSKIGTIDFAVEFMPDTTYYWRVRVDYVDLGTTEKPDEYGPIRSPWSEVRSFVIEEAPVAPPVVVSPTPEITVAVPPAPAITIQPPEIIMPTPEIVLPAPLITLPPSPAPVSPIPAWALYLIIIIGAVLVIALIVLILRTRRAI